METMIFSALGWLHPARLTHAATGLIRTRVATATTITVHSICGLHRALSQQGVSELVITGGETDVCVLAAALGAIDLGYKIVIPKDAVRSGVDATHDASLELLAGRFSVQAELTSMAALISRL